MRAFLVNSMPDKGCTITLLNLDIALKKGIKTERIELYHSAGGFMYIEGMAKINVAL